MTEITQEIFILLSAVLFYKLAFKQKQSKGLLLIIAGLFSMMFIRESDRLLDIIFEGLWQALVILTALSTLYFANKYKLSVFKPLQIHAQTKAFTYIFIGLMIVVIFSRVFATGSFWQIIMDQNYRMLYKVVIQEGLEVLGYGLILFGSTMFYFQQTRSVK